LPSAERCRLSRQRVEADLSRRVLPREKILATVVRLMKLSLARVSNPEYAKQNNSLGLITLRDDHVRLENGRIVWDFRGKHGILHHKVVSDERLARILKNCHHLPGSELFKYVDEAGEFRHISSGDVNRYPRRVSIPIASMQLEFIQVSGCAVPPGALSSWAHPDLVEVPQQILRILVDAVRSGALKFLQPVAADSSPTPNA
jgi:DNA topoisomerase IB